MKTRKSKDYVKDYMKEGEDLMIKNEINLNNYLMLNSDMKSDIVMVAIALI